MSSIVYIFKQHECQAKETDRRMPLWGLQVRTGASGQVHGQLPLEMCHKAMGVPVNCALAVLAQDFTILKNTSNVTYAFSETTNATRHFCSTCGCSTFSFDAFFPRIFIIMAGTLDEDPQIDLTCEIFISNRAPWCALRKDVPGSDGVESWQEIYSQSVL